MTVVNTPMTIKPIPEGEIVSKPDDYIPMRPIPITERLPEDHEATEEGEVWVEEPGGSYPLGDTGDYDWEPHRWILCQIEPRHERMNFRWLPHWALPMPEVES